MATSQKKLCRDEFFAAKEISCLLRFPSVVGRTYWKFKILRVLMEKTSDRRTIINYHTFGPTGTIMKNLNMLKVNDS